MPAALGNTTSSSRLRIAIARSWLVNEGQRHGMRRFRLDLLMRIAALTTVADEPGPCSHAGSLVARTIAVSANSALPSAL
jgi:hypothetical protein